MKTASSHMSKYPKCRTSTLAALIERERKHEQLRREVAARHPPSLFARVVAALSGRQKVGG
jgi:hypothetical protein